MEHLQIYLTNCNLSIEFFMLVVNFWNRKQFLSKNFKNFQSLLSFIFCIRMNSLFLRYYNPFPIWSCPRTERFLIFSHQNMNFLHQFFKNDKYLIFLSSVNPTFSYKLIIAIIQVLLSFLWQSLIGNLLGYAIFKNL